MEKEFFDKYINVSEAEMLKGAIYGQCRIMDKEDIYNWIYEDELKLKKQSEINKKAIEYIKENKDKYYQDWGQDDSSIDVYLDEYEIKKLLQILEDKEETDINVREV